MIAAEIIVMRFWIVCLRLTSSHGGLDVVLKTEIKISLGQSFEIRKHFPNWSNQKLKRLSEPTVFWRINYSSSSRKASSMHWCFGTYQAIWIASYQPHRLQSRSKASVSFRSAVSCLLARQNEYGVWVWDDTQLLSWKSLLKLIELPALCA